MPLSSDIASDINAVQPSVLREALQGELPEVLAQLPVSLTHEQRLNWMRVLACSPFVARVLQSDPNVVTLVSSSLSWSSTHLREALREQLARVNDEEALQHELRRFRHAHMVRIIWLDTLTSATAWEVSAQVSLLAEVVLDEALCWLSAYWEVRWGVPQPDEQGHVPQLVILGMGKLGAGELNLSSDIDLIFAYAHEGETRGGKRRLSHQEYFTKLGQALIATLDRTTENGVAFRVDMRLRPFGDGGPLVGSFNALERYYQSQGREWERYAMLKARPVAGDIHAGYTLLAALKPFFYRKYIDFGVIDALRHIKQRIQHEVRRQGAEDDIKLGRGGIREVEFVVQALQLIHGGRDTRLQTTSLHKALLSIRQAQYLDADLVDTLIDDYAWLRDLEHALQAQEDAQTQRLPDSPLALARLAFAMNLPDEAALHDTLDHVRRRVRTCFDDMIALDDATAESSSLSPWDELWLNGLPRTAAIACFQKAGFDTPQETQARLEAFRESSVLNQMQPIGITRLDALMPLLLHDLAGLQREGTLSRYAPATPLDTVLARVLALLESVSRRTAYLVLLKESATAREQLLRLCAVSPWVAERLARYPMLLDELLDPVALHAPMDRAMLVDELNQTLARLPMEDDEAQLNALCQFKLSQVLRIAVSDLFGYRPLMAVSDALTCVAEVILSRVVTLAWHTLSQRYGVPQAKQPDAEAGFIVVGYGKLGSIELGYGSDLDVVFVHDAAPHGMTNGPRQIDNAVFLTRLGQRIIHLLTAATPNGTLYDVDVRLRPSGSAGLLVTSLDAFVEYQQRHAWLWEQQALVKARPVAGTWTLQHRFERVRVDCLSQPRDPQQVKQEVMHMRQRMLAHHHTEQNIKQAQGGLIDIEFMVQCAVLAYSHEHPTLLHYTDNIRQIDAMQNAGIVDAADAELLRSTLLRYRQAVHAASLMLKPVSMPADSTSAREAIKRLWRTLMGSD